MGPCSELGETMRKSFIILSIVFIFTWIFLGHLDSKVRVPSDAAEIQSTSLKGWFSPVKISNPRSTWYSKLPKVAVDELKNIHVIWVQKTGGNTEEIYYNWTENGTWQEPQRSIMSRVRKETPPRADIKVDRNRNVNVVYLSFEPEDYNVFFRKRKFLNYDWENEVNISNTAVGTEYPNLVIDPTTNDYYIFYNIAEGGGYRILTSYLIKGEGDWTDGGKVYHLNNKAYSPKADIDSKGNIYLVYINRQTNRNVYFTWSQEATNEFSWEDPEVISQGHTGVDYSYPDIAVHENGNAYVVWMYRGGGNIEVYFRKRINGNWQDRKKLSQSSGDSKFPVIAVDKATGDAYVAWEERNKILLREYKQSNDKWGPIEIATENYPLSAERGFELCASAYGDFHLVYSEDHSKTRYIYHRFKKGRDPDKPTAPLGTNLHTFLEGKKKTNIFSWARNPENGILHLTEYVVYRKRQGQNDNRYEELAKPPLDQYIYKDAGRPTGVKYVYAITVRDEFKNESKKSTPAKEKAVFMPQALNIETKMNKALFSVEKINTLTWTDSRLNDPIQNRRYKIYRKKSTDEDSAFTLIYTADSNATSYTERGLPVTEKFVYRLTVIDNAGNESPWLVVNEN